MKDFETGFPNGNSVKPETVPRAEAEPSVIPTVFTNQYQIVEGIFVYICDLTVFR
jgi:hypothetical protein